MGAGRVPGTACEIYHKPGMEATGQARPRPAPRTQNGKAANGKGRVPEITPGTHPATCRAPLHTRPNIRPGYPCEALFAVRAADRCGALDARQ